MEGHFPNNTLIAWIRKTCSGFASSDEEVLEMGTTVEMATLRQALNLVSSVASNSAWVDEHDPDGNLETAIRALLAATRIRRNESV